MPKRSSTRRPPKDENAAAHGALSRIIARSEDAPPPREKDPLAVELGRRGGLKGGKRRMETMTAEERRAIARKGAEARWGKKEG